MTDKMFAHAGTTAMTDAYSDREIEAMMADLESDRVECKESLQGDSPARILGLADVRMAHRRGDGQ